MRKWLFSVISVVILVMAGAGTQTDGFAYRHYLPLVMTGTRETVASEWCSVEYAENLAAGNGFRSQCMSRGEEGWVPQILVSAARIPSPAPAGYGTGLRRMYYRFSDRVAGNPELVLPIRLQSIWDGVQQCVYAAYDFQGDWATIVSPDVLSVRGVEIGKAEVFPVSLPVTISISLAYQPQVLMLASVCEAGEHPEACGAGFFYTCGLLSDRDVLIRSGKEQ